MRAGPGLARWYAFRPVSLTLRLYTDFVCPFCFIAEQSTVPRLLAELDLTLDWYGFELHPSTPPGGVPLSRLFPNAPLPALHERTKHDIPEADYPQLFTLDGAVGYLCR